MLGTFAKTFMTATTFNRHPAFWEVEGFANKRDADFRPRLLSTSKRSRRNWFTKDKEIHLQDL